MTKIGDGVFKDQRGRMFKGCSALVSITLPDSVTTIGTSAFGGCTALKSITIPNSVTEIYNDAFDGCRNLTEINASPEIREQIMNMLPKTVKSPEPVKAQEPPRPSKVSTSAQTVGKTHSPKKAGMPVGTVPLIFGILSIIVGILVIFNIIFFAGLFWDGHFIWTEYFTAHIEKEQCP